MHACMHAVAVSAKINMLLMPSVLNIMSATQSLSD